MHKISTWEELAESDIALNEHTIENFVADADRYHGVALISHDADDRLRLDWGAIIYSVPHQMKHEVVMVVGEDPLETAEDGTIYIKTSRGNPPHLRIAHTLGLAPVPDRSRAYSLCVPLEKKLLDQIEFTSDPAPLTQWEKDLLQNK